MSIARISLRAKFVDTDNKPVGPTKMRMQFFDIAKNDWVDIDTVASDREGMLAANLNIAFTLAPMLRLLDENDHVLSQGSMLQYTLRTRILSIDFGVIEVVGDQPYVLSPSSGNARDPSIKIGGIPHQPKEVIARIRDSNIFKKVDENVIKQTLEIDVLRQRIAKASAEIELRDNEIIKLRRDRQAQEETFKAEKQSALDSQQKAFESKLKQSELQQHTLQAQQKALQDQMGSETDILSLQQSLAAGLESFSKQQANSGSNMRLGRVQVNVKGLFSGAGDKITLADARLLENATQASALSEMIIEYLPEKQDENTATSTVPDLSGLSESAVARLLRALGYGLDVAYGEPADRTQVGAGQAFRQSPNAGEAHPQGRKVLVIFAH